MTFKVGDRVEVWGKQDAINFTGQVGTIVFEVDSHYTDVNWVVRFDERFNNNLHRSEGYVNDPTKQCYHLRVQRLKLLKRATPEKSGFGKFLIDKGL